MDLKPKDVTESQPAARHDLDATNKASAIVRKCGDRAYEKALRALLPDSRDWWDSYVEEAEYSADAVCLSGAHAHTQGPLTRLNQTSGKDLIVGFGHGLVLLHVQPSAFLEDGGLLRVVELQVCRLNQLETSATAKD